MGTRLTLSAAHTDAATVSAPEAPRCGLSGRKLPVMGAAENMNGFMGPTWKTQSHVFLPRVGVRRCQDFRAPLLGQNASPSTNRNSLRF